MKVSLLSKEQKQYAVLGALIGGIGIFCVFTFVLGPMKLRWAEARSEVDALRVKVDEGERLISNRSNLEINLQESGTIMGAATGSYLPDTANPLAWATRTLYATGRDIGLDIQSVAEVSAPAILVKQSDDESRKLGAYAVRVEASCGFDMIKTFLGALEASNPYACVSGITVESDPNHPEQHVLNLTVEWPAWTDASATAGGVMPKGA